MILTDVSILFQLQIFFVYSSGDYSILKQYYVYDVGDFIADIGGYMVRDSTSCVNSSVVARLTFRAFAWVRVSSHSTI